MSKTYLRGDLYYADLGHGIGSEQKGTRPVVIIQNNVGNKHSPTVIIAAVTSKANVKAKLPTHYYLDAGNGLVQPSLVLLEQIRTVDKRRLSGYIGRLDEEHIRGINHALAISIGLIEPVPPKLTLCLCDACADAFRGTGAFVLREAAQGQAEEKVCVYCGQYPGIATDKTPTGKRDDISLREKEAEINRDIADGIDAVGKKMTVCQLYAKQNSQRADVKRATKKQREYLMGLLRDDPLGRKSIDAVKPSDAKEWAIRMKEKGFSFQSISNYKRSLRAAFFIAIEDDCVRKNPFSFALNKVLEDNRGEKNVLTPEQEVSLIDFVQNDKVYRKYVDELIILLGTGLRISEFCGLTTNLDFKNRLIRVDHQLLRDPTSVLRFTAKSLQDTPRYAKHSPKRQIAETPENLGFATICRVT